MTMLLLPYAKDPEDPNHHTPFNDRTGNCLELAAQYVVANDGTLVHGSIYNQAFSVQRIGHAWVVREDGWIFEPTQGARWNPEAFRWWFTPIVDATYSVEEACINMLKSGHYGTWSEDHSGVWG